MPGEDSPGRQYRQHEEFRIALFAKTEFLPEFFRDVRHERVEEEKETFQDEVHRREGRDPCGRGAFFKKVPLG